MNSLVSWSGGKDSCFAALKAIEKGYKPKVLLNVLNEEGKISRSHGIPEPVLKAQAGAAGIPLHTIAASWQSYEAHFKEALAFLREKYDLTHAVFGDIDMEAHRQWEENVCKAANLEAVLPLWQADRKALVRQMLTSGLSTIIVSCNEIMGERFIGKELTTALVEELEALGIDPCGENGEFHTLVTSCSLFKEPIHINIKAKTKQNSYWFADIELATPKT